MSENPTVYVAEAYKDGERIEQLVHVNESDAYEDINITTSTDNPDRIEVSERRLWLGQSESFTAERPTRGGR